VSHQLAFAKAVRFNMYLSSLGDRRSAFAFAAGLLFLICPFVVAQSDAGSPLSLEDLIANVRASEHLYRRLEVKHRVKYQLLRNVPSDSIKVDSVKGNKIAAQQDIEWILSSTVNAHTVYQGHYHYLDHRRLESFSKGRLANANTIQGYDGQNTRIAERGNDGAIGNIHEDDFVDGRYLQPHLLLLEESAALPFNSLSDYMAATKYRTDALRWRIIGEDTINGIHCIKASASGAKELASMDRTDKHGPHWHNIYWIADERNFLILKAECYRAWRKGIEPQAFCIGEVTKLKELSPGLWFPVAAQETIYDVDALYEEGRKLPEVSIEWFVDDVGLNPNYDAQFFRNIDMPPGSVVYRVKGGKTVGSYREPEVLKPAISQMWLLGASLLGITCLAMALLVARTFVGRASRWAAR
jgi:hypothetical protein